MRIQTPGDSNNINPSLTGCAEVPDLIADIDDFIRFQGEGTGNSTEVPCLAGQSANAAYKRELIPHSVNFKEGLDVFLNIRTEDTHVL